MSNCANHSPEEHTHKHHPGCGHQSVIHDGHTDYLHDGHLHHIHGDHVDEHRLEIGSTNPSDCTPQHHCDGHDAVHRHGPNCGHERAPHGDHVDYIVEGHLHHYHGSHCDDHGTVKKAA